MSDPYGGLFGSNFNPFTDSTPGAINWLNPLSGGGGGPLNAGLVSVPLNFLNPSATSTFDPTVYANPTINQGGLSNALVIGPQIGGGQETSASIFGGGGGGHGGGGNITDNINYHPSTTFAPTLPTIPGIPQQQPFMNTPNMSLPNPSMTPILQPNNVSGQLAQTVNMRPPIAAGGYLPLLPYPLNQPSTQPGSPEQIIPGMSSPPATQGNAQQAGGYAAPSPPPTPPQMPMGSANAMGIPMLSGGISQTQIAPTNQPGMVGNYPFNQITASNNIPRPSAPPSGPSSLGWVPRAPKQEPIPIVSDMGGYDEEGEPADETPTSETAPSQEKSPEELRKDANDIVQTLLKQAGATDKGQIKNIFDTYKNRQKEIDNDLQTTLKGSKEKPSLSAQLEDKQAEILNKQLEKAGIAPIDTGKPTSKMPEFDAGAWKERNAANAQFWRGRLIADETAALANAWPDKYPRPLWGPRSKRPYQSVVRALYETKRAELDKSVEDINKAIDAYAAEHKVDERGIRSAFTEAGQLDAKLIAKAQQQWKHDSLINYENFKTNLGLLTREATQATTQAGQIGAQTLLKPERPGAAIKRELDTKLAQQRFDEARLKPYELTGKPDPISGIDYDSYRKSLYLAYKAGSLTSDEITELMRRALAKHYIEAPGT